MTDCNCKNEQQVADLCRRITEAAEYYYLNEPILTDQQFDRLLDELRELDPNNPLLTQVGFMRMHGAKELLPIEIKLSLPKVKSVLALPQHEMGSRVVVAPKLDGLTLILEYKNGILVRAMTRGDGVYGVNITHKVMRIPDVPKQLSSPITCCVRGEGYFRVDTFEKYIRATDGYANPRNSISAILVAQKGFNLVGLASFSPFDITADGVTHVGQSAWDHPTLLQDFHNKILCDEYSYRIEKSELTDSRLEEILLKLRKKGLPVDGLVLDGVWAWKSKTEEVEAVIDRIDWEVTPRRRVVPVAILESPGVQLYGTTVYRATVFNYAFVQRHKLGKGARVKITKANEIIPYITDVVAPSPSYTELETCPRCGSKLELDANRTHLTCVGKCENQLRASCQSFLRYWVLPRGVADLDSVVDALYPISVNALVQAADPANYNDTLSKLTTALGPHRGKLMADALVSDWRIKRNLFLESLGLDSVGRSASEQAAQFLDEIVSSGSVPEQAKLRTPSMRSVIKYLGIIKEFYQAFKDRIVAPPLRMEEVARVCITGPLSISRQDFVSLLENVGVKCVDRVAPGVILITNDKSSGSSKNKMAKQLGCDIISEAEARSRWDI